MTVDESILKFWRDKVSADSHYTSYKTVPARRRERIDALVLERFASQAVEDYKEKLKDALVKANNNSKYPMTNGSLFEKLIDSIK